jgi:hypothetical protein
MGTLIARGARINKAGWTPLHYAAAGPSLEAVELLLAHGAALEAVAPNGNTPLMMAAGYGAIDSARLLLRRGPMPVRATRADVRRPTSPMRPTGPVWRRNCATRPLQRAEQQTDTCVGQIPT